MILPVDFTEHEIHGSWEGISTGTGKEEDRKPTNNSHSVGQKMATGDLVESSQVGETRGTDLAPVRTLRAVTNQEDSHLTLGGLDSRVRLTRGNGVALGEQKEVVNESFHVLLHGGTRGRGDLVILDANGAGRHLVQALVDDTKGLAELLHTAEITIIAVAVDTNRDVELDLVIGVVRLGLADIPWDTGTTEHDTTETHVQSISRRDDTDALSSGFPNSVIREQFLGLVDTISELGSPLVDIVEETKREILRHTTGADVGGVETGTGDSLVEFLFEGVISTSSLNYGSVV